MNELLCDKLWPTIGRLAKRSASKRAAIAYVSSDKLIKFGKGDVLVTDASNHAIAMGQTSAEVLHRAFKRSAQLYSLSGLHAKVLLIDGTAVIGSANLSGSSANSLVEAAWVTDNPVAIGMGTALINELIEQAEVIDARFLARVLKIKVKRSGGAAVGTAKRKPVKIRKSAAWIIGVHEFDDDKYPEEQEAAEAGEEIAKEGLTRESSDVSWIRWTGNSRFCTQAREGDTVIQLWSPNGSKRPEAVYRHAPILRRQNEKSCTRFYVEDFRNEQKMSLSWVQFKKLIKKVGLSSSIGPNSARPITAAESNALFSLWSQ